MSRNYSSTIVAVIVVLFNFSGIRNVRMAFGAKKSFFWVETVVVRYFQQEAKRSRAPKILTAMGSHSCIHHCNSIIRHYTTPNHTVRRQSSNTVSSSVSRSL